MRRTVIGLVGVAVGGPVLAQDVGASGVRRDCLDVGLDAAERFEACRALHATRDPRARLRAVARDVGIQACDADLTRCAEIGRWFLSNYERWDADVELGLRKERDGHFPDGGRPDLEAAERALAVACRAAGETAVCRDAADLAYAEGRPSTDLYARACAAGDRHSCEMQAIAAGTEENP